MFRLVCAGFGWICLWMPGLLAQSPTGPIRTYENQLTPINQPKPLLADYPEYFEPILEKRHFEAPAIVMDAKADLHVRAWRFSYNARGIIEMPNHLRSSDTAVIVVHPWAIDDEWGWKTPEPSGVADFCTPDKNALGARHSKEVIDPFLKRLRGRAGLILYSLPGPADRIRIRVYRSFQKTPTASERVEGEKELRKVLAGYKYQGQGLPGKMKIQSDLPVVDYFKQFPGLDATARYNGDGFWKLPIPVSTALTVDPLDVVIYDEEGYGPLREFLKKNGIRHVLLTGYATDMCFCKTTAGYENLSKDFNVIPNRVPCPSDLLQPIQIGLFKNSTHHKEVKNAPRRLDTPGRFHRVLLGLRVEVAFFVIPMSCLPGREISGHFQIQGNGNQGFFGFQRSNAMAHGRLGPTQRS